MDTETAVRDVRTGDRIKSYFELMPDPGTVVACYPTQYGLMRVDIKWHEGYTTMQSMKPTDMLTVVSD